MAKSKKTRSVKSKAPAPKKPVALKVVQKARSFDALKDTAGDRKMVLHIGCGKANPEKLHKKFQGDDWFEVRLDIDPSVEPDIVSDMSSMPMIPDSSLDALWSSHNVEHLYPHMVNGTFKEFFRILKPGGFFLVTLPDIQTVAGFVARGDLEEAIYDSPAGPITPIDIMYGLRSSMAKGNLFMAHRTAFTAKSLGDNLREVGFSNIRISREWIDLWGVAYKYPLNHPKRSEKMEIFEKNIANAGDLPAPMPLNRTPHPGTFVSGKLTDELDLPPKAWQPLGLKKPAS